MKSEGEKKQQLASAGAFGFKFVTVIPAAPPRKWVKRSCIILRRGTVRRTAADAVPASGKEITEGATFATADPRSSIKPQREGGERGTSGKNKVEETISFFFFFLQKREESLNPGKDCARNEV